MKSPRRASLGLLVAAHPDQPGFTHSLRLAEAALRQGVAVYLYCLDEAVYGLADSRLQDLRSRGLKLWACGYGAQQRQIPRRDQAAFAGLSVLADLLGGTDRFVCFS